jgi:hypothetical protein
MEYSAPEALRDAIVLGGVVDGKLANSSLSLEIRLPVV